MTIEFDLVCDGCGNSLADEQFFDSEAALLDLAGELDWSIGADGKHYCDGCPNMPQGPVFIRACPPADADTDVTGGPVSGENG